MNLWLYYKDPSWDAKCWAIVDAVDSTLVIASGLTASEAMSQCNAINNKNKRWGEDQRVEVKLLEYPGTPISFGQSVGVGREFPRHQLLQKGGLCTRPIG